MCRERIAPQNAGFTVVTPQGLDGGADGDTFTTCPIQDDDRLIADQ